MLDNLMSYAFYLVTGILLVGIPLWYLRGVRRRKERTWERFEQKERLGLSEPVTLHPLVNADRCVGIEACIDACPEGEILGVINGKATLVSPTHCIGHGACASACPVNAITLVFGTEKRGVDIPELKPNFETNVDGIFIAGELGGMGLIRNAVTQGWEAVHYIKETLAESGNGTYDVAIIGAGPAGLSASLKAMELGLSFVCVEQEDVGGTILTYPRRKVVMTQPMVIPLHGEVNKREMFKEELLDLWYEIIEKTSLEVNIEEKLEMIEGERGNFQIKTTKGDYVAKRVLLSIGRRGTPRKLGVEGEKSSKVAYRLLDPEQYANSRVLVVGGGDSAIEAALSISEYSEGQVMLSYRGDVLSRAKDQNREKFENAVAAGKVKSLLKSEVQEIREKEVVLQQEGETVSLENDYVLVFIGGILPTGFLQKLGISVSKKFGEA